MQTESWHSLIRLNETDGGGEGTWKCRYRQSYFFVYVRELLARRTQLQCPRRTFDYKNTHQWIYDYQLYAPQEVPCRASSSACSFLKAQGGNNPDCAPSKMLYLDNTEYRLTTWSMNTPGGSAVCGHGNREFSFFFRLTASSATKQSFQNLMIVFLAGGMCWDAGTCGNNTSTRTMSAANNPPSVEPTIPESFLNSVSGSLQLYSNTLVYDQGIFIPDYDFVVIPDCTGDLHIGNRSFTYGAGTPTCFTAHHLGAVNTGKAIEWIFDPRNTKYLQRITIVSTGLNNGQSIPVLNGQSPSAASTPYVPIPYAPGAHGGIFWAPYIQKLNPQIPVKVITEQSLGVFGPKWKDLMKDDPWGATTAMTPDNSQTVLPSPSEWSFLYDDISYYYEVITRKNSLISFADIASSSDENQKRFFIETGGSLTDCCLEGCNCSHAASTSYRSGQVDWLKSFKVAVIRRSQRLGLLYRSWIHEVPSIRFLLTPVTIKFGDGSVLVIFER
eukprot:754819-Hanusia_phi.AAC.5